MTNDALPTPGSKRQPEVVSSNLVAELRKLHAEITECDGHESEMMALVRRAADEIERQVEIIRLYRMIRRGVPGEDAMSKRDSKQKLIDMLAERSRKHDAFRLAETAVLEGRADGYHSEMNAFDLAHGEVLDWLNDTDHLDELLGFLRTPETEDEGWCEHPDGRITVADITLTLPDTARLDWLQEALVDTIYLDDGRIIDVGGGHAGNLRQAIDMRRAQKTSGDRNGHDDALKRARDALGAQRLSVETTVFQPPLTANECWEAIDALIKPGDLGGNGWDKNAERNGLILAANRIAELIQQRGALKTSGERNG